MATLVESSDINIREYTVRKSIFGELPIQPFKLADNGKHKSKKWEALMTDCAFYFDQPSLQDESQMKRTLQHKYDDLFKGPMKMPLQSRKDLVNWACAQQNQYMEEREAPELKMECSRY